MIRKFVLKPWMVVLGLIAAIAIPATVYGMTHEPPPPPCRLDYTVSRELMVVPIRDDEGFIIDYETQKCR